MFTGIQPLQLTLWAYWDMNSAPGMFIFCFLIYLTVFVNWVGCLVLNECNRMITNWEGSSHGYFKNVLSIGLEELRKTTQSQVSWSFNWDWTQCLLTKEVGLFWNVSLIVGYNYTILNEMWQDRRKWSWYVRDMRFFVSEDITVLGCDAYKSM